MKFRGVNYLLIGCLLLLTGLEASGQYWMQFGGGATIDEGLAIDADASGNFFTTGYFTATAAFGAASVSSAGLDDIFIVKTNPAGLVQWLKRAGGTGSDKAYAVAAGSGGNVAVTGYFSGSAQFDTQTLTSSGQQDAFVAVYNAAGGLVWAVKCGGPGSDVGRGIAVDAAGNVLVTGEFSGTCTFGSFSLTSSGGTPDVFTMKLSPAGTVLWVKQGSGPATDRGTDIAADAAGNVYVSGSISDTVTFDLTHNNAFNNAVFLIKYSPAGQEQWFRWMGSNTALQAGGMDLSAGRISLTGTLTGTLYFFGGTGIPQLATTRPYNVYICRYDTAGTLAWSVADGSSSEVDAAGIVTRSNGDVVIAGSYKCRFTDYSARYGAGVFCSMGYWDSYVAAYDNTGAWLWSRNYGSPADDNAWDVALQNDTMAVTTGSFEGKLIATNQPSAFLGYGTSTITGAGGYCSDNDYFQYVFKVSSGNKDVVICNNINLAREPFDYYYRAGVTCTRDVVPVCIGDAPALSLTCPDTIFACGPGLIYANPNTYVSRAPQWAYQWNTGSATNQVNATVSGNYAVTITSADGCFTSTDSVYYQILSYPPAPEISDDKGVNTGSTGPLPLYLCEPDSVLLTCVNAAGYAVQWTGFTVGQNPVQVTASGTYICRLTNAAGCSTTSQIEVHIDQPLQPIVPGMVCLQDNDHNDTIDICLGDVFSMMPYDTLGNPMASTDSCIRYLAYVGWDTTGLGGNFFFSTSTTCTGPSPVNSFLSLQTGSFDLMFTDTIVRASSCDSDTVIFQSGLLHVNVNPVPTGGSFPVSISAASTQLCPGSTLALVAVGGGTLTWTDPNGQLLPPSDTVYATVPGTYSLAADSTVTNSFGCSAPVSGFASITITSYAQPVVTAQPVTGVICPNDSVKLTCSGTGGYTWQGPSGTLVQTDSVIYVASPGAYSCVLAADSSCNLLSNTIQVSAYSNPFVLAFPAPGLCDNNPVQLTVVSSLGSNIQWQPPLSGSQPVQTVSDSGTYTCTVVSCGITSPLSFTVYRDTAVAMIYTASSPPEFCAGDSVWLTANTGMAHYDWQPSGDSTLATYVTQGGLVTLVTTSTYGCTDTATILVTEQPNTLVPPAVTDTSVCSGFPADLVATGPDTICWAYSPSYSDTFLTGNVLHLGAVTNPVSYYVYTRSGLCKSAFDTVTAGVDPCHDIFIPNVFTPDGDNLNDFFPGKSGNYSLDMKVYNRWGRLVYESAAMDTGWDGRDSGGKLVGSGTYYYVMDVTFLDDSVENFRGAITVISGQ